MSRIATKIFFCCVLTVLLIKVDAQTLTPLQNEVMVTSNTYNSAKRIQVDVESSSGRKVYVWQESDDLGSTPNNNIVCKIYDADMNVLQSDFVIHPNAAEGDQIYPVVKINQQNGTFVIAWASSNSTTKQYDIFAKKFSFENIEAGRISPDLLVNEYTNGRQILPKLAIDYAKSEVIVAWLDQDKQDNPTAQSSVDYGSYARRISTADQQLATIGGAYQFSINKVVENHQTVTDIAISPITGELYTLCGSMGYPSDDYNVVFRKFARDANGNFSISFPETVVNETKLGTQHLASFTINTSNGDYYISWSDDGNDGSGWGIYAKGYDSNNLVIKGETCINGLQQTNSSNYGNQLYAKLLWEQSTNNLIAFYWYSTGNGTSVRYQFYDEQLNPIGVEQQATNGDLGNYYAGFYVSVFGQSQRSIVLSYDQFSGVNSVGYTKQFKLTNAITSAMNCKMNVTDLCVLDATMNWTNEKTFDENGNLVSESRSYSDKYGRPLQTQSRNIAENQIIASSILLNRMGEPSVQTLPAPIVGNCFCYKPDFIKPNSGGSAFYTAQHFDQPITTAKTLGEVNNPVMVSPLANALGVYYNGTSTDKYTVAATHYPYISNWHNNIGTFQKTTLPGDAYKMGSTHEVTTITLPILWELDHYISLKPNYPAGTSNYYPMSFALKGIKTISKNSDGNEGVAMYDSEGKLLATCLVGGTTNQVPSNFYATTLTRANFIRYSFQSTTPSAIIEIYVDNNTLAYYTGPIQNAPTDIFSQIFAKIIYFKSKSPFTVATKLYANFVDYNYNLSPIIKNVTAQYTTGQIGSKTHLDIHVPQGQYSSVVINGGAIIYDLTTGLVVSSITSGGYYRLVSTDQIGFGVSYNLNYYDYTYYYYDDAGRLIATISPNQVDLTSTTPPNINAITTYTYSSLGQVLSVNKPDEGLTEFVYRKDGQLQFSQNALQKTQNNSFSYIKYDLLARPIESGEYHSNVVLFKNMNGIPANGTLSSNTSLFNSNCYDVNYILYSAVPTDLSGRTQKNLTNRISSTWKKANGLDTYPVSQTWYSYTVDGQLAWSAQALHLPSYITAPKTLHIPIKFIDYAYDLFGRLNRTVFQNDVLSERFEHRITYDVIKRLKRVQTRAGAHDLVENAEYKYNLLGSVKRTELGGNLQGIDYAYTTQGWLKAINSGAQGPASDIGNDGLSGSSFPQDEFSMQLNYYQGDHDAYAGSGYSLPSSVNSLYNGNIIAASSHTKRMATSNPIFPTYSYNYDHKNQLLEADFGYLGSGIYTPSNTYDVKNLSYDANGNIKRLVRYNASGLADINAYYQQETNKNQTKALTSDIGGSTPLLEFKYNAIGQRIEKTLGSRYYYNPAGLVVSVEDYQSGSWVKSVSFDYDERGQRIRKTQYTSGVATQHTWYYRDTDGSLLAVYESNGTAPGSFTLKEQPVYAANRVGIYRPVANEYNYELTDYLGNVRATFRKCTTCSGNQVDVLSYADYYPHGGTLPNRTWVSSPHYRNGYQGQFSEKDDETGLNAFDLRMYDSELGLWASPDPFGQYHSPYVAMGNNPIMGVDLSGGISIGGVLEEGVELEELGAIEGLLEHDPPAITEGLKKGDIGFGTNGKLGNDAYQHFVFDGTKWGLPTETLSEAVVTGSRNIGWGLDFFDGIPIITSPWATPNQAFTPGPFIIKGVNVSMSDELIRHEAGHTLTFYAMGADFPLYITTIAIPSALNLKFGWGGNHDVFYTEKVANTLAEKAWGPFKDKTHFPTY